MWLNSKLNLLIAPVVGEEPNYAVRFQSSVISFLADSRRLTTDS